MSTVTTYLNLVKAATLEPYSVATTNTNLDMIDAAVLGLSKYDKIMLFKTAAGFAWSGGGADWDAGVLVADGDAVYASQASPAMAFAVAGSVSGSLKFTEPGIYDISWNTGAGAEPGLSGYRIQPVGSWPGSMGSTQFFGQTIRPNAGFYFETFVEAISVRVPTANLEILFKGRQTNATTNTPRIKIRKVTSL